jgi:hypothetical protein
MRKKYEVLAPGTTTAIGKLTFDDEQGTAGLQLDQLSVGGVPVPGEQRVRLLGPFRIAHDTVDIGTNNGNHLGDVPAGALVIRVFALNQEVWAGHNEGAYLRLSAGEAGANPNALVEYLLDGLNSNTVASQGQHAEGLYKMESSDYSLPSMIAMLTVAGSITASISGLGSASAGEADVYALIAEPAE